MAMHVGKDLWSICKELYIIYKERLKDETFKELRISAYST